jgi:hypothetical protein
MGTVMPALLAAGMVLAGTAAAAGGTPLRPRPNQVGVVVTAHEIFVSWRDPAGSHPAAVIVRRGAPACPRAASDGVSAGELAPFHVLDLTVKPGTTYCYAVFLKGQDGRLTSLGNTGAVAVPDVGTVPPAHVTPPAPLPTGTRFDTRLARRVAIVSGAALAAALMLLALALVTRARISAGRVDERASARGPLVTRNAGAMVVPAMIALAWITLLVVFVARR